MTGEQKRWRPWRKRRDDFLPCKMVAACGRLFPGEHPSDVIRQLRLGNGMTQREVAELIGVSISSIKHWSPDDLLGLRIISDAGREVHRRAVEKTHDHNRKSGMYKRHIWSHSPIVIRSRKEKNVLAETSVEPALR